MFFELRQMKFRQRLPRLYFVPYLDESREALSLQMGRVDADMKQHFQPVWRRNADRVQRRIDMDDRALNRRDEFALFRHERDAVADQLARENRIGHFLERDHAPLHGRMELHLLHVLLHQLLISSRISSENVPNTTCTLPAAEPDDARGAQDARSALASMQLVVCPTFSRSRVMQASI